MVFKSVCGRSGTEHLLFTACAFVLFSLTYVEKYLFNNNNNNNNTKSMLSGLLNLDEFKKGVNIELSV